jgi:hypothetical protein
MAKDLKVVDDMLAKELEAKGFREGFKAGTSAALQSLAKFLEALRRQPLRPHDRPVRSRNAKPLALRPNSDQARALQYIQKHPGQRGIEIVRAFETSGPAIRERTLRTALRRLRLAGYVRQDRDGCWHATKGAPKE